MSRTVIRFTVVLLRGAGVVFVPPSAWGRDHGILVNGSYSPRDK
ncbi:MAG: hypothetical protein ACUVWX_15095 [Kiritimatiellia bacterium]